MRRRIKRNCFMGSEENSSRASALKNSNNNNNNKKISQKKITNFFKPPNNEKKDTNEVQNNNKQENTAQSNKNIDKSWKLGTLNINNQYKLFKSHDILMERLNRKLQKFVPHDLEVPHSLSAG